MCISVLVEYNTSGLLTITLGRRLADAMRNHLVTLRDGLGNNLGMTIANAWPKPWALPVSVPYM